MEWVIEIDWNPHADNLTDNDFLYGGTSYRIHSVVRVATNGALGVRFNTALSTAAKRLTFNVDSSSFNIADGSLQSGDEQVVWTNPGLSWTAGDMVSLSLVEPADTAPGKPTGLSASANGATQIDLSWTAPTDIGSAAISGYRVEVSSDGGSTFSDLEDDTESTSTTYAHTGLSAGTTRHYRVSAINSVGTGAASDTASATTDTFPGSRRASRQAGTGGRESTSPGPPPPSPAARPSAATGSRSQATAAPTSPTSRTTPRARARPTLTRVSRRAPPATTGSRPSALSAPARPPTPRAPRPPPTIPGRQSPARR